MSFREIFRITYNIARIFRVFNVVEYKNPQNSVTIEAYHKTQCYGWLCAALNKVDMNEVSVTVVATRQVFFRKPRLE